LPIRKTQSAIYNLQFAICNSMKSLRSRLTLTHALVALVAVVIVAVLATGLIRIAFNLFAPQADADTLATQLADRYEQWGGWDGVVERIRRARQSGQFDQTALGRLVRNRRVQIVDSQGYLIFDSAGPAQRRLTPRIPGGTESAIIVDGQQVGSVVISGQRAILNQAERSFLGVVYLSVIGGSILAALVALAVGLVITGRVTRPLRTLRDAAQRLASGAHHEPLPIPPDRELAELAISFNTMAAELEHQQHLRRQLVADIAHELRTPLSVLRVQIESLEDGIEQPTPATLHSFAEEVSLLTRLVDDLRLLSLADAGQLSLAPEELDAAAMIERAMAAALPRARQQQVDLRAERPSSPLTVMADPQRLAQILGNLIENALRYTPAGGIVTLRVSSDLEQQYARTQSSKPWPEPSRRLKTQNSIVFEVADTGAGVPPDELPRIFERFYRTDKARARETGGTGLGLAIVQRLVEMQGGRIWASSTVGHGTTFYVALPAAEAVHNAPLQAFSQVN